MMIGSSTLWLKAGARKATHTRTDEIEEEKLKNVKGIVLEPTPRTGNATIAMRSCICNIDALRDSKTNRMGTRDPSYKRTQKRFAQTVEGTIILYRNVDDRETISRELPMMAYPTKQSQESQEFPSNGQYYENTTHQQQSNPQGYSNAQGN